MKLSSAVVKLKEEDLMSLVKDYIKIEGLQIDSIKIDEIIEITGKYRKKVDFPFTLKIGIGNIKSNIVYLIIYHLKVYKLGIMNFIKNAVARNILKDFIDYGIKVYKDTVEVDLNAAVKLVPHFNFNLVRINILKGEVEAEVENIVYEKNKTFPDLKNKSGETIKNGRYSRLRKKILEKIPEKYSKLANYVMLIPDIMLLLWRLLKDKRVESKVKIICINALLYIASPIDFIPGFIPVIGEIDDVAVAFFALNMVMDQVPEEIIMDNWQGEENIILVTREVVKYVSDIAGVRNISIILKNMKKIFGKPPKKIITKEDYKNIYSK